MSETPRCSIDSRYEREGAPHDAAHETAVAVPVPFHAPQSVSVGLPGAPVTYASPAGTVTTGGVYSPVGSVVVGQQPIGVPVSTVTVINNPPPAGSPCPVCGKPLGDPAANKGHAHHGPPASPRFSKATPEVFRDGFKPLWDAAQAETAAYVVVSGCNKLMGVLLKDLEAKAKSEKDPNDRSRSAGSGGGGLFGWGKPQEKKPTFAERIEKLQKKGFLLRSTVNAAKESGMTEVLTEKIDASAVTNEMAKRYVQLLWQVADQGFEQPGWSQSGEFPKAVAGPPEDHAHAPAAHATHAGGGHTPSADGHGH